MSRPVRFNLRPYQSLRSSANGSGPPSKPLFPAEGQLTMATKTLTNTKVAPLADRVVVKALEDTEQMRGGLFIPDTAKEKPQQGEIIAVGPGRNEKNLRVPMEVNVGDKVLYGKYSGTEDTIN